MKTLTAEQAIKKIEETANETAVQEKRIINKHVIGKCIRQGDLYIHMVGGLMATKIHKTGDKIAVRKLAEGTSVGSRHILKGKVVVYEGVEFPKGVDTLYPLGLCFDVVDIAIVEHPEHAHVELPTGRYQITHQMDMRTRQRVQD